MMMLNIIFFLGAGASVVFDKPTTTGMRHHLRDNFNKNSHQGILHSLLEHYPHGDIEDVLQSVRDIQTFNESHGGKYFLKAYKTFTQKNNLKIETLSDTPKGIFLHKKFTMEWNDYVKTIAEIKNTIENEIFSQYQWVHKHDSKLLQIYGKIFNALQNYEIRIATTNYDRVIEEFCIQHDDYVCADGFKRNRKTGILEWANEKFPLPDSGFEKLKKITLYKLHGSLNWKNHVKHGIIQSQEESKSNDEKFGFNYIIYPTISPKDGTFSEPYKTVREEFEKYLNNVDVAIVIGFSFRDKHVTDLFKKFIKTEKRLIVISPSLPYTVVNNLAPDGEYDFGTMSSGNMTDSKNITLIKMDFNEKNLDEILSIIMSRIKHEERIHGIKTEFKN